MQQTARPGWSVARLARESGIHRSTIFRWIRGDGGLTLHSVRSIAQALNVSMEQALSAAGELVPTPPDEQEHEPMISPVEMRLILQVINDPDVREIMRYIADPTVPADEKAALRIVLQMAAQRARARIDRNTSQESYPNG